MLAEKQIADALVAKLESLNLIGVQIVSNLATSDEGCVRNAEYLESDCIIEVKVPPRAYDTAQIPTCTISPSVSVSVRIETDATGMRSLSIYDSAMELVQRWQDSLDDVATDFAGLAFEPVGFRIDGGSGPEVDGAANVYRIDINFSIRGFIK